MYNGGIQITPIPSPSSEGNIFGPGSSTDNAVVRWEGTDGTQIQNSSVIISDAGSVSILTSDVGGLVVSSPGDGIIAASFSQNSNGGFAVYADNSGTGGVAIYGQALDDGTGVQGAGNTGVIGGGDSYGVLGTSSAGVGVQGTALTGTAVNAQVTGVGYGLVIDDQDPRGDAIPMTVSILGNQKFLIDNTGLVVVGSGGAIGRFNIEGSDGSISPFNLGAGTLTGSSISGDIEYDGSHLYFTDGTSTRRTLAVTTSIVTDHGALTGLSDDDHTQYALLDGRSGGQLLYGGTAASDQIEIYGTSNATKGKIHLNKSGGEVNVNDDGTATGDFRVEGDTDANLLFTKASTDKVGIGTNAPGAKLDIRGDVIINEAGADFDVRIEGDTDANLFFTDASADFVGIGTNAPGAKLDVRGSVIINEAAGNFDVRMESQNNPNLFFLDASTDAIGIGTSSTGSARLALAVGTTSLAPFSFTDTGNVLLTSAYPGAVESNDTDLFYTNSGSVRQNIALANTLNGGYKFVYNSASSIDLQVASYDNAADVPLANASNVVKMFHTSSTITASLASSGANGLDTGSETSSTFYYVWGIGKEDGTLALLFSVSSSSPTMPSGYTYKRLLWGVANDGSSNILAFVHLKDGTCLYTGSQLNSVRGAAILNGGTATSFTAVSMAVYAPDIVGVRIDVEVVASNSSGTNSLYSLAEDSGGTVLVQQTRTVGAGGGATSSSEHWTKSLRVVSAAATSLYYKWGTNSGAQSSNIYLQGWNLGGPIWF